MCILRLPVVVLVALLSITACSSKTTSNHISWVYGSVGLSADVTCETTGSTYTIVIPKLQLTFQPDTNLNKVDSVRNPRLQLVTIVLRPGTTRSEITSSNSLPLNLSLDKIHRMATVSDLRLVVDKWRVRESTYTALNLTDGDLLWPSSENLKQCALSSNSSPKRTREKQRAA